MIPMIMFQMIENPQHTIYRNKNHFEFYSTPSSFELIDHRFDELFISCEKLAGI